MAVNDMDLAGVSLASLRPHPATLCGLGDWGIPFSGSRLFSGFARRFGRSGTPPGFECECIRQRRWIRVLRVATHPWRTPCLASCGPCLGWLP